MLERFAQKFRLLRDDNRDLIIKCRNGFVYEHGPASFGVWINSKKPNKTIKTMQAESPGLEKSQVGDGECTVIYRFTTDAQAVKFLRAVGAHKKRKMTDEQKAIASERLKQYRYAAGSGDRLQGCVEID